MADAVASFRIIRTFYSWPVMKHFFFLLLLPLLQGCTVLAIADAAASTVIYGVKTTVNVIEAITPDIVNKDKEGK